MTKPEDTNTVAGGSPLDGGVRALEPERANFERHAARLGYSVDHDTRPGREGGYWSSHTHLMWETWQAARPKRAAVGAIVNVAAELAQRKPLEPFDNMTEQTHIGHRQFDRVYRQADERVRLLACKLADAVRAL